MSSKRAKSNHSTKKRKVTFWIFPIISILIAAYCINYIINWSRENGINKEVMETIVQDIVETNEETGETKIDFVKLKNKNKEVIGWLKVNNTKVDYPVVQAKDNDYYINHNFNGESNLAGWVFADYRVKLNEYDDNIVIYAHNMKDGSMFGTLKKILTQEWYNNEENMDITFETETEVRTYKVFSVYEIPVESYYTNMSFKTENAHQEFLNKLKSRSKKDFGVSPKAGEKIITLSTCATNDKNRIVLHAVLTNTTANV